jgi:hypothetical protein
VARRKWLGLSSSALNIEEKKEKWLARLYWKENQEKRSMAGGIEERRRMARNGERAAMAVWRRRSGIRRPSSMGAGENGIAWAKNVNSIAA